MGFIAVYWKLLGSFTIVLVLMAEGFFGFAVALPPMGGLTGEHAPRAIGSNSNAARVGLVGPAIVDNSSEYRLKAQVYTLFLYNGTSRSGNLVGPRSRGDPSSLVYDPATGYVYVAETGGDELVVVKNLTIIGYVALGQPSQGLAYDASDGDVYVGEVGTDFVAVISNLSIMGVIRVGASPASLAYDQRDASIYVVNWGSASVTRLRGEIVMGNYSVGDFPLGAACDQDGGVVYVAQEGSNTVALVNGSGEITSLPVGLLPCAVAWDPANGYVYVVDQRSNSVSVIDGMRLIANITVGSLPDSVTYDPQNHCVYVANAGSNSVSVIYNLTCLGSFPVGPGPSALAYDSDDQMLYVADSGDDALTAVKVVAPPYVFPVEFSLAYDSDNQMLYVADSGDDALTAVKVVAPPYVFPVEFSVIGISKREWRLCVNGTYLSSRNGTLTLYLPRGDYQYEVYPPFGYVGKALSGGFQVNSSRVITVVLSRSTLPPIRLILLMIAMISVLAFIVSIIRRGYRGSSKTDDIGFIGGFAFCRFPRGALPFRAVGCIPPRILPWFVPVPDIRGLTTVARWQAPALIEALGEILKPATDDIL